MKHETLEKNSIILLVAILVVVSIGGIVQIAPLFWVDSTIEKVKGMRAYTPLEQAGRDIYLREGCFNCHSQMIRPFRAETERYGHYSVAGESVYDHPFQWGSKRTGPDLARVGARYSDDWHRVLRHEIAHLERYDDWSNFFQRLLIAFNPVNPFLWLVGNELRLVREIVCDDWVVAESRHAKSYAQLLTRLAVASRGLPSLASGVSRTGRQLYRRVARILDTKCNRKLKPSWVTTTFAAVGLLGTWTYLSVHSIFDNLYVNNLFLHIGLMLVIVAVLYNQASYHVKLRTL